MIASVSKIAALGILVCGFFQLLANASERPPSPIAAMTRYFESYIGVWRGKGWLVLQDGSHLNIDATFEVSKVLFDSAVRFDFRYEAPGRPSLQLAHRVALLTYTSNMLVPQAQERFNLRFVVGGIRGTNPDVLPYWGPVEWVEPNPDGGQIRHSWWTTGVEWSASGFCCSGTDNDRMSTYLLLHKE